MNKQEIMELLNIGENREVEFKESYKKLPKSLWETYSSFANTRGGIIILGIKENKETKMCTIEGVEEVNNILKDFWNTINNSEKVSCNILNDDCVEIMKVENRMLLIVNVPNANRKDKPIYINNNPITGTYKRYHDGDYRCNKKEIQVLFSESTEESKDEIILNEFNINSIDKETLETIAVLLSPFAPHFAEEMWEQLGHGETIFKAGWPSYDESAMKDDEIEVPVQINGKTRAVISISADASKDEAIAAGKEAVADKLTGTIVKEIYVPKKIINIVQK